MIMLPLHSTDKWQNLSFSKIPSNQVEFKSSGVSIKVENSASPLIYPLDHPVRVSKVKIKGRVSQLITFKDSKKQGEKGFDDYVFRLGLVIPGDKKLNWAMRMMAADWVKKLYSLAPKDAGINHIYFLNLGQTHELQGRERVHPLSDLIKEKNEWVIEGPGEFELSADIHPSKVTSAVWLSIDGDDTKSHFQIDLSKIELTADEEN